MYTQLTYCIHGTHSFISSDLLSAIKNLKHDKKRWLLWNSIRSYNLLRWEFECSYCNYNLTILEQSLLSSILCKLLDVVILTKEKCSLCTSDLQYGFKQGSSTSLWTAMAQATISYYVHNGSNVYGLMLDASKAFDRVNYCKLFRILQDKNVCPPYCRLLLNMFLNQSLGVRWDSTYSQ